MLTEIVNAITGAIRDGLESDDEAKREEAKRLARQLRAALDDFPDYSADFEREVAEAKERG